MKTLFFFIIFLSICPDLISQSYIETRIPSEIGGTAGIYIRINKPPIERYSAGAPIVIHIAGGFGGEGLGINSGNLFTKGKNEYDKTKIQEEKNDISSKGRATSLQTLASSGREAT